MMTDRVISMRLAMLSNENADLRAEVGKLNDTLAVTLGVAGKLEALLNKPYPIQDGPSVPWWVMKPHESQSQRNHGQSIDRIAQRAGFGSAEAWCVIRGLRLREISTKKMLEAANARWCLFAARVNDPNETSDTGTIANEVALTPVCVGEP